MDGPGGYYVKSTKSDRERHMLNDFTYQWKLKNIKQMNKQSKAETDLYKQTTSSWLPKGKEVGESGVDTIFKKEKN